MVRAVTVGRVGDAEQRVLQARVHLLLQDSLGEPRPHGLVYLVCLLLSQASGCPSEALHLVMVVSSVWSVVGCYDVS